MADNLTPAQRSRTMSRIRSKDTKAEVLLRRLVHARGLRYRKHAASLPGKPDMVFSRAKVVVFVDGDFWHGWNFDAWKDKLAPYWRGKIEGNMARDVKNRQVLTECGWQVEQVWEHEIKEDAAACAARVEAAVRRRRDAAIPETPAALRPPTP